LLRVFVKQDTSRGFLIFEDRFLALEPLIGSA
jgi:hypothetical protein